MTSGTTPAAASQQRSKPSVQHDLRVEATRWIGPHMIRVILTGDSLADFDTRGNTDAYVKLLFVDPSLEPPFDLQALRSSADPAHRVTMRTYTVRWADPVARLIAIDFVTHGDSGIAAPWAASAQPGDRIVTSSPGGAYAPAPEASWHLLAGDLAAVPAIAAALEAMPANAKGVALIEVANAADIIELATASSVRIEWLINDDADDVEFLARAIEGTDWPRDTEADGGIHVFVHGERSAMKAARAVLRNRGVAPDRLSVSAYWARGRTEDVFQAEKREPIGKIE